MELSPGLNSPPVSETPTSTTKTAHVAQQRPSSTGGPESERRTLSDPERSLIDPYVLGWVIVLHAGALAAPFFFDWRSVALVVVLHWLTGGIGICLGFHRYFTHASFQTVAPVRWLLAMFGGLAGEGSAIDWVANHRKHHAHSDQEGDPHSPLDGKWWSHMIWLAYRYPHEVQEQHIKRWAPDMNQDPVLRFFQKTFLLWHFVLAGVLFAAGYAWGGMYLATSFVVWGMFLRLCFVLHATWFVNSASHIWGYRNYVTTDQSTNNWWVALITYGEGWHNNHHAFPRMAAHGHRWWEIDVTFTAIRVLRFFGLAWDVVDYKRGSEKQARQAESRKERRRKRAAAVAAK